VLVAVGHFAVGAESCVVVEPSGADLGEAQGRPERPGDAPGEAGVDGAAVAVAGGDVLAQQVPLSWPGSPQEAAMRSAGPLVPPGGQLTGGQELDVSCGGAAGCAWRGDHHRLGHAGLDLGLVFPFPGHGPGVLTFVLAYLVEADFDGFPVQDAVTAADAFPGADGAQFRCGDGGLDAQAVQVLEVVVGYVPGVAAARGVGGGLDLKVVGGPVNTRSWPSKVSSARMRMKRGRSRSSSSSAVSLIGCGRGGSRDASWQTPSLTPRRLTDSGPWPAGHATGLAGCKRTVTKWHNTTQCTCLNT
jgi:hypothetical protein